MILYAVWSAALPTESLAWVLVIALCGLTLALIGWSNSRQSANRLDRNVHRLRQELADQKSQLDELTDASRAERQTLFNSMSEGVLVLDLQNRIVLVNHSFEKQFELKTDVRGLTLLEAIRSHELTALVNRLLLEGPSLSTELFRPGSPPKSYDVNAATVLGRDGQADGTVLVIHDVSRLRELEGIRREFVANVSHELRTPMSLIRGGVETLLDGAKDDPATATQFLETIERHTLRLSHLLDDLLTLSRLESGTIQLACESVPVKPFVDQLLKEWAAKALPKGIQLVNEVAPGLTVDADPERLEQVLLNLIDNAVKYGKENGTVRVTAGVHPANQIQLGVVDDGPGIPVDARERVFERFYRLDKARARDTGGTGLGLAIVKHIVQSHGGIVWCEGNPGEGAHFYFTLPGAPSEK